MDFSILGNRTNLFFNFYLFTTSLFRENALTIVFKFLSDDDEDERNLRRVSYLRATKDFDSDLEEIEDTVEDSKR